MKHEYKVSLDGHELHFTQEELFAFLLDKVHASYMDRDDVKNAEEYTTEIFKLISPAILSTVTFNQLFSLFFLVGFYYSNFLNKNQVEFIKKQEEKNVLI